jgi:D-alanine-D-alanine ligase-like ATP-grasp enzyme
MSIALATRIRLSRARVLLYRAWRKVRGRSRDRNLFYEQLWQTAAAEINAVAHDLGGGRFEVRRGDRTTQVRRNYTELDDYDTVKTVGNKPLIHERLKEAGIPIPSYRVFPPSSPRGALDFLAQHTCCVVKPAADTGAGDGVTTGITTVAELHRAIVHAAGFCSQVMIENQVEGENIRLLYLDGELLDAVWRRPPSMAGDGRLSVAQMVLSENRHRLARGHAAAQVLLRRDPDMDRTLAAQELTWNAVPEAGRDVCLKTVINDNAAADNVSIIGEVATELVETGREAARLAGVRLAGVDVITPNPSAGLRASAGVVLEINSMPGLYIHCRDRADIHRIAAPILEAALATCTAIPPSEDACAE